MGSRDVLDLYLKKFESLQRAFYKTLQTPHKKNWKSQQGVS